MRHYQASVHFLRHQLVIFSFADRKAAWNALETQLNCGIKLVIVQMNSAASSKHFELPSLFE